MITQASISEASDVVIAQTAVDYLEEYFPGYEWTANYDEGVLSIKNLTVSSNWGLVLRVQNLSKRLILNKGGEFLNRFNMPYRMDQDMIDNAPRDFTGGIVSEKWTQDRRYYNKKERRWKAAI